MKNRTDQADWVPNPNSSHPALLSAEELTKQCQFSTTRRGGPGGQHRNKVESAVVVQHLPTEVLAEANERRNQHENRKTALFRLRVNLALACRMQKGHDDGLTELWTRRVGRERLSVDPAHDDFPGLLAEALDWIVFFEFDVKQAAEKLRITTSQLVKFLKLDNRGLKLVNSGRLKRELHRLR